jgi:glycosidase
MAASSVEDSVRRDRIGGPQRVVEGELTPGCESRATARTSTLERSTRLAPSCNAPPTRTAPPGPDEERAVVEHPFIYELNTWVWLGELSRHEGTQVDLAAVPGREWDAIAALGFDAVWLMGVWERSPAGIAIALENDALIESFRRALPDFAIEDVVGSPYCIRGYTVDARLGGPDGLAAARAALAERGLGLILDFVPNHVAPDHAWTEAHPEYFVGGNAEDVERDPASFVRVGDGILANGRDPYFPAWPDVVQLNAFSPDLRAAVVETLGSIATQCDGVRCDMAMLMMNDTFERTWGDRAGSRPDADYWPTVIPAVKEDHPGFVFAAEAYWDLESALQEQGFDYCYDKRLYDRLVHDGADQVHDHLTADVGYQRKLVRFIENHDEPRAAAAFPGDRARAAAVATLTQTGARLVHEGQLEGRRVRLPVFLARRPTEPADADLRAFYERLLTALRDPVFRDGEWQLAERTGWPGNDSWWNLVAWGWRGASRKLVVVNLGGVPASAHVSLPWDDLRGQTWVLDDASSGERYERSGDDLRDGLYVALDPWFWHLFSLSPLDSRKD